MYKYICAYTHTHTENVYKQMYSYKLRSQYVWQLESSYTYLITPLSSASTWLFFFTFTPQGSGSGPLAVLPGKVCWNFPLTSITRNGPTKKCPNWSEFQTYFSLSSLCSSSLISPWLSGLVTPPAQYLPLLYDNSEEWGEQSGLVVVLTSTSVELLCVLVEAILPLVLRLLGPQSTKTLEQEAN